MARTRSIVLTGDATLNKMLSRLSGREGREAIRKSARPALQPVLRAARRNAPVRTGQLSKSIKIRALRRTRRRVGARVFAGEFTTDTFYGGFLEWGWKTGRRGASERTQVEGIRFMGRAAEDKKRTALTIYRHQLKKNILAIARRRAT